MIEHLERERDLSHSAFEKVGMVANFSELHDQVHKVVNLCLVGSKLEKILS